MRFSLLAILAVASMVAGAESAPDLANVTDTKWVITSTVMLASACGGIGGGCFKNANGQVTFLFPATQVSACLRPELTLTEWRPAYPFAAVGPGQVISPAMKTEAIAIEAALVADAEKKPIAHVVVLYTAGVITAAQTKLEEWGTAAGVTFTMTSCSTQAGLLYAMMNDVQASAARANPMFAMVMPLPDKMKLFRSFDEFGPSGAALGSTSSGMDISLAGGGGDLAAAANRIEATLAATKADNPDMSVSVNTNTKQVQVKGIKPADLLVAANAVSIEREVSVIRPSKSFDTSDVPDNDGSIGVIIGASVAASLVVGGAFMYGHSKKHKMLDQYRQEDQENKIRQSQHPQQRGGGPQQHQQGRRQQQRQTQGGQASPQGRGRQQQRQTQQGGGRGRPQGRPGQSMKPGGPGSSQNVRGGNGGGRGMTSMQSGGGVNGSSGRGMNSKYSDSKGSQMGRSMASSGISTSSGKRLSL